MRQLLLPIVLTLLAGSPALASSSAWHEAEGVRLRLVTSGQADASGMLKGVLQIDLDRDWKTYWRDPGGSGVPPSIDISGPRAFSGAFAGCTDPIWWQLVQARPSVVTRRGPAARSCAAGVSAAESCKAGETPAPRGIRSVAVK